MTKKIILLVVALGISGCASKAGPFVTNISSDGRGGLIVEKCMVRLDRALNTVENAECTHTQITLGSRSDP